ncbi:MAG: hypothetical protein AAF869_03580, partial [Pseudomonadota bacterium]
MSAQRQKPDPWSWRGRRTLLALAALFFAVQSASPGSAEDATTERDAPSPLQRGVMSPSEVISQRDVIERRVAEAVALFEAQGLSAFCLAIADADDPFLV